MELGAIVRLLAAWDKGYGHDNRLSMTIIIMTEYLMAAPF